MRYTDFKSYIQDNYEGLLRGEISKFVNNHHDGIGFHGYSVLSVCGQDVDNIQVHSVQCHDEGIGDLIRITVNVMADIVELGLGTRRYEACRKTRLFMVCLSAELKDGLHDVLLFPTMKSLDK